MFCKIASHLKLFQLCRNENEIKFIPILACFLNIISFINTVSIHSTHWDTHNIFRGKLESVSIVLRKISARPDFNHFARIQSFQNITIHKVREYLRSGWEYVWKQYKGQISGAHNIHQHGAHMLPIVQRRSQWLSTVSGLTGDHRRIYQIHKFFGSWCHPAFSLKCWSGFKCFAASQRGKIFGSSSLNVHSKWVDGRQPD